MKAKMPHEHNQSLLAAMTPIMRYDNKEPFTSWQERAIEKLNKLLGLPLESCEDCFTIDYTKEREGFTEIRFSFQSEEGYFVPCHLRTSILCRCCLARHECLCKSKINWANDHGYILA